MSSRAREASAILTVWQRSPPVAFHDAGPKVVGHYEGNVGPFCPSKRTEHLCCCQNIQGPDRHLYSLRGETPVTLSLVPLARISMHFLYQVSDSNLSGQVMTIIDHVRPNAAPVANPKINNSFPAV